MITLALTTPKGGTGKTFTTANGAVALAELGLRVGVVDFDPQGDLSVAFGVDEMDRGVVRVHQLLAGGLTPQDHTISIPVPDAPAVRLLPADEDLASAAGRLARSGYQDLAVLLEDMAGELDVCLIDTPAGITPFGLAALVAADAVISPMRLGFQEFRALDRLVGELEQMDSEGGSAPLLGAVLVEVDARWRQTRFYQSELRDDDSVRLYKATIRRVQGVSEHAREGLPTIMLQPDGRIARDYRSFARETLSRLPDAIPEHPGLSALRAAGVNVPEPVAA